LVIVEKGHDLGEHNRQQSDNERARHGNDAGRWNVSLEKRQGRWERHQGPAVQIGQRFKALF
jgi:hypothetical protein